MRGRALLFAALVAAGCGAQAAEEPPAPAAAAAKTEAAATWRFAYSMTYRGIGGESAGAPDEITQTGHGEQDATRDAAHVVVDGEDGQETIHVGGKRYMRVTSEASAWIVFPDFDVLQLTAQAAMPFAFLGDPTNAIDMLRATVGDQQPHGPASVRGVQTVRSHIEVDITKLAAVRARSDEERQELDAMSGGQDTIGVDLWIDADGRLRRLAYTWDWGDSERKVSVDGWIEFFDFGADMKIERPANVQVIDEPRCGSPEGSPIRGDRVVEVLRRNGFAAKAENRRCGVNVTNYTRNAHDDVVTREGMVQCTVTGGDGSNWSSFFLWSSETEKPREIEITVENVECRLYVVGEANGAETRFRAALDELQPSK